MDTYAVAVKRSHTSTPSPHPRLLLLPMHNHIIWPNVLLIFEAEVATEPLPQLYIFEAALLTFNELAQFLMILVSHTFAPADQTYMLLSSSSKDETINWPRPSPSTHTASSFFHISLWKFQHSAALKACQSRQHSWVTVLKRGLSSGWAVGHCMCVCLCVCVLRHLIKAVHHFQKQLWKGLIFLEGGSKKTS